MGFNAVLAAAGGAMNYMARRQVDKRVKVLCHFDNLPLNEITHNNIDCSELLYRSGVYSNCAYLYGNAPYIDICQSLSGDFSLEMFSKSTAGNVVQFYKGGQLWQVILSTMSEYNGLYSSSLVASDTGIGNIFYHIILERYNNTLYYYRDGVQRWSYTMEGTLINVQSTAGNASNSIYIDELRLIDGLSRFKGASSCTIPTSPYTGYEAL